MRQIACGPFAVTQDRQIFDLLRHRRRERLPMRFSRRIHIRSHIDAVAIPALFVEREVVRVAPGIRQALRRQLRPRQNRLQFFFVLRKCARQRVLLRQRLRQGFTLQSEILHEGSPFRHVIPRMLRFAVEDSVRPRAAHVNPVLVARDAEIIAIRIPPRIAQGIQVESALLHLLAQRRIISDVFSCPRRELSGGRVDCRSGLAEIRPLEVIGDKVIFRSRLLVDSVAH